MPQYWISFRSLTHAQRAVRTLERNSITAIVSRLPQGVSPKGCGYAVIVRQQIRDAVRLLEEAQIPRGMVFEKTERGDFREVKL